MRDFNWNDLKFFLALVRAGNATAASRVLGVDHNTVRRRLAALEADLRTRLFDHRGENHSLNDAGQRLFSLSEAIERRAGQVYDEITGQDVAISGTVRLGTPDGLGTFFVAPRLVKLSEMHPKLNIELVVTSHKFNLSKREVDMSIQIDRPFERRITIRKLGTLTMRLYAAPYYLEQMPPIRNVSDLRDHKFVSGVDGLDFGPSLIEIIEGSTMSVPRTVCTSSVAQLKAVAGGAGLCLFSRFLAETEPTLVPVLAELVLIKREVWLSTHSDLQARGRIKAVARFFAKEFLEARRGFS
jgi:DNA-binding transcriptional LysR family regulator